MTEREAPLKHQGLIGLVARRYLRPGIEQEDLMQEGNFGLFIACERYDADRRVKFSAYANYWIRHAIQSSPPAQSWPVRVPINLRKALRRGVTEESPGRLNPARIRAARFALEASRIDTEESPLDTFAWSRDQAALERRELVEWVRRLLDSLEPREREILVRRFGLNDEPAQSLSEVGEAIGVTKERVRQIEKRALAKLRGQLRVMV